MIRRMKLWVMVAAHEMDEKKVLHKSYNLPRWDDVVG